MFGIAKRGVTVAQINVSRNVRRQLVTSNNHHHHHNNNNNNKILDHALNTKRLLLGLGERPRNIGNGANGFGISRLLETVTGSSASQNQAESPNENASNKISIGRFSVGGMLSPGERYTMPRNTLIDPLSIGNFWSTASTSLQFLQENLPLYPNSLPLPDIKRPHQLQTIQGARFYHTTSVGTRRHYSTTPPPIKPSQYKTSARIPTPKSTPATSSSPFASIDPKAILRNVIETTWNVTKAVLMFLIKLPGNTLYYMTHSNARREKIQEIKDIAQHEFDHYWTGTKLLMADVRTARDLVFRTLSGSSLTRRERKQLLRTVSDLFRLVPFSMFILIPLAEFALPFALRLFPNMLPSTFQDSLKAEETMKRELQSRIAMAQFFQETLEELAKEQKRIVAERNSESPNNEIASKQQESAEAMLKFLDSARKGEMMPPEVIIQYAKYFQDDLTLDNMPRMQLVNMCRYMDLQPYGSDSFLRFQLRHRIRMLKEDDQRIIWEGIDSLTKMELREACQERGMRSTGLSKEAYKRALQQWLHLSVHQNVPISLLIMSRTFFLQEESHAPAAPGGSEAKSVAGLADAISGMDKEVLNEVLLEVATSEERKSNPGIRKIKLEVVTQQNEMIREEREANKKKKKVPEKTEAAPSEEPVLATEKDKGESGAEKLAKVAESPVTGPKSDTPKAKEGTEPFDGSMEKIVLTIDGEKERELTAAEMDAISQLLSADPVSRERLELARIKSAMQGSSEGPVEQPAAAPEVVAEKVEPPQKEQKVEEKISVETPEPDDKQAATVIAESERVAAEEAEKATTFSTTTELPPAETVETETEQIEAEKEIEEEKEDPVVARLKKRIESMVDKIELQLSDVEGKIGDKLHILDKDKDGVLSLQEMAEALHLVLKREITFEEAMEIAETIDENEDGVFTVQELINWIERNKLVRLETEGRDADMDRIMESQPAAASEESTQATDDKMVSEPTPEKVAKQA